MKTSSGTARYVELFALPRVAHTFSLAVLGRAGYPLVFLPLLYAVSDATGSIALAGVAVATYGAAASFLAPVRAWVIDRRGAQPVLRILILVFGLSITALAVTCLLGGSGWVLIAIAGIAGGFAPPLGPTMRVAWAELTPSPEFLRKGLSLDAVVEELLYLAGPVLVGLALVGFAPGAMLFVPGLVVLVGGLLFASSPAVKAMKSTTESQLEHRTEKPLLLQVRFVGLLLPVVVAGSMAGVLSLVTPVILADDGGPAAAGVALGLFAGGSALGGLVYGATRTSKRPVRQLIVMSTALVLASSLIAVTTGVVPVSAVAAVSGLFFSPVMIVAYLAAQAAAGPHQQNASTTWVNTAHNFGGAAGSALTGVLVQAAGTPASVSVVCTLGVVGLLISACLARR